jgi:hypothetical protein
MMIRSHTHTHTHTHTHMDIHTHLLMNAYINTCIRTCMCMLTLIQCHLFCIYMDNQHSADWISYAVPVSSHTNIRTHSLSPPSSHTYIRLHVPNHFLVFIHRQSCWLDQTHSAGFWAYTWAHIDIRTSTGACEQATMQLRSTCISENHCFSFPQAEHEWIMRRAQTALQGKYVSTTRLAVSEARGECTHRWAQRVFPVALEELGLCWHPEPEWTPNHFD